MTDDLPTPCRPLHLGPVHFVSRWHASFHLVFGRPLSLSLVYYIHPRYFPQYVFFVSPYQFNRLSVIFVEACASLVVPRMCLFLILLLHVTPPAHRMLISFASLRMPTACSSRSLQSLLHVTPHAHRMLISFMSLRPPTACSSRSRHSARPPHAHLVHFNPCYMSLRTPTACSSRSCHSARPPHAHLVHFNPCYMSLRTPTACSSRSRHSARPPHAHLVHVTPHAHRMLISFTSILVVSYN